MIRELAQDEIEAVLRAESVGRIGCHVGDLTYVVPISYVYHDGSIFGLSPEGQKITMMRQNPAVCFEVDHEEDEVNWHSVIAWGTYEELGGEEAAEAVRVLVNSLHFRLPTALLVHDDEASSIEEAVVYRIRVREMTGREERLYWGLLAQEWRADEPSTGKPHAV